MKLKFRAEKKDFIMFGIFALVLLYLVAIAILNVVSFLSESTIWGLNPFPAFGPDYLAATLVFWFFALAGVFLSVKSYFFDRDKGVGISTQKKKESGYASYHMIVEIPVYLTQKTIYVKCEIQIRTLAMDFWASFEHKVKYKSEKGVTKKMSKELVSCAKMVSKFDNKMIALKSD